MTHKMTILEVRPEEVGLRLDALVAQREIGLTRSQAEKLIRSGLIRVGGQLVRPARRLEIGERVEVSVPAVRSSPEPEPIPLEVLYEDEDLLVVNKPQGMTVHPSGGRAGGTLVSALLARVPDLAVGEPHRPGIVHRLDRGTSGLMVVAKSAPAFEELSRQVRARELERTYLALVWGEMKEDRVVIEVPIGRHLRHRTRMAAVPRPSASRPVRSARTEVRTLERLGPITLVEARIATGRTHQIRVHLAHQGHPVVGDPLYGRRRARQEELALHPRTLVLVSALPGQALHAHRLVFRHPARGQVVSFSVPMPKEMARLTAHLRTAAS